MSTLTNLTVQQLQRALVIRDNIEALKKELELILRPDLQPKPKPGAQRYHLSAAGRAVIRAAAKARWAKFRKSRPVVKKRKSRISALGRASIAVAARARWKKVKAAGHNRL